MSQRPAEVNTRFRGNTNEDYIFSIAGYRDIQPITQMIGPAHRQANMSLRVHKFLHVEAGQVSQGRNKPRRRK